MHIITKLTTSISIFPDGEMIIVEGLDGLNAASEYYLDYKTLVPLIEKYKDVLDINRSIVEMEIRRCKRNVL